MNISEKIDLAIKEKETGSREGAYVVTYNDSTRSKETYMTNAEWEKFEGLMKKEHPIAHNEYSQGDGGELTEKKGCPPKMASYGSSSRMIYNLSKENADFHYEMKLPTTVGGTANLDGFLEDEKHYIFVEAKCHEPYKAKKVTVSKRYNDLYRYINAQMVENIRIEMTPSKCGRNLNVEYYAEGEMLERFDMKQMICHLLGIATGLLNGTLKKKQIDFIYLLYDPTELDITGEAKEEIDEIYYRTCYECNLVDFAELFRVILEYLKQTRFSNAVSDDEIDHIICKFTFTLASQEFYRMLIQ